MRNSRERQIRKSRKLVTDEQLVAILRAMRGANRKDQRPMASRLINEELDGGETLDQIFYTGSEFGYWLEITPRGQSALEVEFGCSPGPDAGDGGTWMVELDENGAVRSVRCITISIS